VWSGYDVLEALIHKVRCFLLSRCTMHRGTSNVSKCGSHHSFKSHFSLLRLILSPPKSPSESSKLPRAFLIIARTLHSSLRLNELYEVDASAQIASIARVFLFLFRTKPPRERARGRRVCVKVLRFSPFI